MLRGHELPVLDAAASPDGTRIVTVSRDHTARIWDCVTGTQITVLRGHDAWVVSAAFSSDGARIVTASDDRTVRVWDAATGAILNVLRGHENWVRRAIFSPDGVRIITVSFDRTVRVWNAQTGAEITQIILDAGVTALAVYDRDIALGDALGRIHVFEAAEFLCDGGTAL